MVQKNLMRWLQKKQKIKSINLRLFYWCDGNDVLHEQMVARVEGREDWEMVQDVVISIHNRKKNLLSIKLPPRK